MKPHETVLKFIALRAKGCTFADISKALDVAEGTLINWSRKYRLQIQNLRQLELETLKQKLGLTQFASLEQLSADISRIREELAKRDLSTLPAGRLVTLASLLRTEASHITTPVHLAEEIADTDPLPDETLPVVTWEV